jgi:hypothetical protein
MIFTGLLSNVKNRLTDWLNTTSVSVAGGDLALDLCNRGREMIWQEADWEPLLKRVDLTVDPITKAATLPADFGKIINCNFDPLGYGKAIGYFSKDGDLIYGYKIDSVFDAVTGFSPPVLTFFYALSFVPKLVYKATLPRFTTGADQPTFFPEGLLLRAAQLQHVAENGTGTSEYQIIRDEYLRELWRYRSQVQGVNTDMRSNVKDDAGNTVRIVGVDLSGDTAVPRAISPSLDNKYGM